LGFIFVTKAFLNERLFHNFYRYSYYEEYIRSKYSEQEGLIADIYIDRNKCIEEEKSKLIFQKAKEADSLNQIDRALRLYNYSIDLNPDDAQAYHRRGFFKLNKLELDKDIAYSAIKDFNRAIRLKPDLTMAYFHRFLATGYLNLKRRSYLDRLKVWNTDSMLSKEAFQSKYGMLKDSFSIPFHP
jgi:tetratricopeptide (TPR) repeat protein